MKGMALEMRPVAADEVRALVEVDSVAFGQPERVEAYIEQAEALLEPDRTHVVFDSGRPVAAAAALSWELTVPGPTTLPAAAVTYVGVVTTHRRRGLLTNMMRAQLEDVMARGEPMAVLLASESLIYGRFGYGVAVLTDTLEIDRTRTTFARPFDDNGSLRLLTADEARKEVPALYEAYRGAQPGEVSRSDGWWTAHFSDPEWNREGASGFFNVVHESSAGPDGYATYRVRPSWPNGLATYTLEIWDLLATDPTTRTALWRYCLDVDLVTTVQHLNAPVDEPLRWQLAEPRRLRVTRHGDFLWVRLLDIPRALVGRSYAAPVDVVFEVEDGFFPQLGGRYRLHAGPDGAKCERTDADHDIALGVADLGAAYLGGVRFATLARAGRVVERTPGALARADAAFASEPSPYCSTDF
jgi:predicted acetyltransferase